MDVVATKAVFDIASNKDAAITRDDRRAHFCASENMCTLPYHPCRFGHFFSFFQAQEGFVCLHNFILSRIIFQSQSRCRY